MNYVTDANILRQIYKGELSERSKISLIGGDQTASFLQVIFQLLLNLNNLVKLYFLIDLLL